MIILLTTIITIFITLNIIAFWCVCTDYEISDVIYTISGWFLAIEGIIIGLGVIIIGSYIISHHIVCNNTNNDYKGCAVEEKVSDIDE